MAATLSFVPSNDTKLLEWSLNFSTKLTANPVTYNFVAAQALQYSTAHSAFSTALSAVADPLTRTKANMITKNNAKKALQALARAFGRMIQANPGLTDAQKVGMGVTVRSQPKPSPIPATSPSIEIIQVTGWTVKFRLKASSNKRGKPANVTGASFFSYVGTTQPTDPSVFKFEGNMSKPDGEVVFSTSLPAGTTVWLTAFWFNGRMASGPAAQPVGTNLLGSGDMNMAA